VREKYHGGDQVHTANGSGMEIDHISLGKFRTPSGNFILKDVLYVPQASKNLVSIHKLARDNHAFFEFHPNFFLIKNKLPFVQEANKEWICDACKRVKATISLNQCLLIS
jgi:hypothetical protein